MTTKEQRKLYYLKNKEYIKQKAKEWSLNNKERKRKTSLEYRINNLNVSLWRAAKYRAETSNIEFNIEKEDIIIPEYCPYLNIKLDLSLGKGKSLEARRYSPSLDRINPKKGYIKGNIEVISWLANTMKNNATKEELISFANYIINMESRYE